MAEAEEGWWCFGVQLCAERPLGKSKMQKVGPRSPVSYAGFTTVYTTEPSPSPSARKDVFLDKNRIAEAAFHTPRHESNPKQESKEVNNVLDPNSALAHWAEDESIAAYASTKKARSSWVPDYIGIILDMECCRLCVAVPE